MKKNRVSIGLYVEKIQELILGVTVEVYGKIISVRWGAFKGLEGLES